MSPDNSSNLLNEELFTFLYKLCELTQGQEGSAISLWSIAKQLEYSRVDALQIADVLQKKSLLTFVSLSGNIQLTSLGRFEVMLAISQPNKATRLFPAITEFSNTDLLPTTSVSHTGLAGILLNLREFSHELNLSENTSDKLSLVFDHLESVMESGRMAPAPTKQVLSELHLIDKLLNSTPPQL